MTKCDIGRGVKIGLKDRNVLYGRLYGEMSLWVA